MNRSLVLLRRDLRLTDHLALFTALQSADEVAMAFVFDENQTKPHPYFSPNSFRFLLETLQELNQELSGFGSGLIIRQGSYQAEAKTLLQELDITSLHVTRDYTPFARKRDDQLRTICEELKIDFQTHSGLLLQEVETTKKADGKPYTVFTPYYKNAQKTGVPAPLELEPKLYKKCIQKEAVDKLLAQSEVVLAQKLAGLSELDLCPEPAVKGGRLAALKLLQGFTDSALSDYATGRDIPSKHGTSRLSAYHKFGVLSPRETYTAAVPLANAGSESAQTFLSELHWRDFQTQIGYWFPHVYTTNASHSSKGANFRPMYDAVEWTNDAALFEAWCQGGTGYPIVDAGMRELNATGYMHNRVRMIVASFLTKDLHIDWRWGGTVFCPKTDRL